MEISTMHTIHDDEGERLTVYEDTLGNLTVGIGHKVLPEDELGPGDKITAERSMTMFLADLKEAEQGAHHLLDGSVRTVSPVEVAVVTNMVFQMGLEGVKQFRLFWAALRAQDHVWAAKEMLDSKWAKQTPARAQRLAGEIELLASRSRANV